MAGFMPAAVAALIALAPQQAAKPAIPKTNEKAPPAAAVNQAPPPVLNQAPAPHAPEAGPLNPLPPAGPPKADPLAAGVSHGNKTGALAAAGAMGGLGWLGVGAGLTAVFGLLTSAWGHVKAFAHRLFSFAITTVEIPNESAHDAVIAHLLKNYKRSRIYDRMYGAYYEHHRDGKYGLVPFEQCGLRSMIFWNGKYPFIFKNAVEAKAAASKGSSGSGGGSEATKVHSTLTFVRGTVDVEKLLSDACAAVNSLTWTVENNQEKAKNRFVIHHFPKRDDDSGGDDSSSNGLAWYQQGYYRLLSHQPEQLGKAPIRDGKALDGLIFPQRVKDLIGEIELWRNSRDWYRAKGIPWKRGWLLYGPPGTGKTALARAFAEDLNMPVYVFNLAEMGNQALLKAWSEMQVNVPCVALIEDIDNVFHGRKNVARRAGYMGMSMPAKKDDSSGGGADFGSLAQPLTFDCLLNCLDGVERTNGVFTIVTTNDLSKIDPALGLPRQLPDGTTEFISTRPGRVDKAVELTYMEPADKKLMAKRILGEYPDDYLTMLEFVDKFADLLETPAQFQERCAQMALKRFWKEKYAADPLAVPPPPAAPSANGKPREAAKASR